MNLVYKHRRTIDVILGDLGILIITFLVYKYLENSRLILLVGPLLILINTLRIWFEETMKKILDFIIKYRFPIALIVFIVCVSLKINGSSIGVYDAMYGQEDPNIITEIFGRGRSIRSDEFNVQIPYFFSQSYNDFNLISHYMSLSGQNMIIGYNSPVIGLTLLGKPDIWGYILFGNEIGLSWYWCSRIILFLLVGYEMFYILTKNKYLSVFASICLVFSPALQWWFAPHMYQVFFWACTLFVVGYYFFFGKKLWQKILFTILSICSLIGFVISIFPSLQVPTGLIMLALLICCLIQNKENLKWNKMDWLRIALVIIGAGIVLGQFLIQSKDAISLLNNTVYPGKRISVGGNYIMANLFTDPTMILSPFMAPARLNQCEISTFNHFGILFMIYYPYLWYINKMQNKSRQMLIGNCLFIILAIEIIFMLIGFPEWLAKITLFSYMNRMMLVYGFTALLFSFWSIEAIWENRKKVRWQFGLGTVLIYTFLYIKCYLNYTDAAFLERTGLWFYFIVPGILGMSSYLIFTKYRRLFFPIFGCWIILAGMFVNPIVIGARSISNHTLVTEALEVQEEDPEAYWLATNSFHTQELLLANGIKVLNAVNFYPDVKKWELVDPTHENEEFYNRYLHMLIELTEEPTSYDLTHPDSAVIHLNIEDIKKWNIKYLVVNKNAMYENLLNRNGITVQILFSDSSDDEILQLIY